MNATPKAAFAENNRPRSPDNRRLMLEVRPALEKKTLSRRGEIYCWTWGYQQATSFLYGSTREGLLPAPKSQFLCDKAWVSYDHFYQVEFKEKFFQSFWTKFNCLEEISLSLLLLSTPFWINSSTNTFFNSFDNIIWRISFKIFRRYGGNLEDTPPSFQSTASTVRYPEESNKIKESNTPSGL